MNVSNILLEAAEVLATTHPKLSSELELHAFTVTRRKATAIDRLRKKIGTIKTHLLDQDLSEDMRTQLSFELSDLTKSLSKLLGVDPVAKPNKVARPATVLPDVIVSK